MTTRLEKLPRQRVRRDLMPSGRFIKMLKPQCPLERQDDEDSFENPCSEDGGAWWVDCEKRGHDPYYTTIKKGDQEVRRPNLTQVALNIRVNSGQGVESAKRRGRKMPEEMGLAPFCQYLDCWSQNIKFKNAEYGDYCTEDQLKMVMVDVNEVTLEVLNEKKRRRQLAQLAT